MTYTIAIHPDHYGSVEKPDCYSLFWQEYLELQGCLIKIVNAHDPDIIQQLRGCHGFMWRWFHGGQDAQTALRIIPVIEKYLGIPCYPDWNTCWHYDDKAAQAFLFDAVDIPTPQTWFFTQEETARCWIETQASFPLVLKLTMGAGSSNVILLHNKEETLAWLKPLFQYGITHLYRSPLKFPVDLGTEFC